MRHYWKSPANLPAYLAYKVNALNPGTMATADSHLEMFSSDQIGCILLVVQAISSSSPPIITLVAAPFMATISASSTGNPPVLLANIWAKSVLQPFAAMIDMDQPHCPIMAASKVLSHATITAQLYIEDAQPMVFSAGEILSNLVDIVVDSYKMLSICILERLKCFPLVLFGN
jgi:hypothetical protein